MHLCIYSEQLSLKVRKQCFATIRPGLGERVQEWVQCNMQYSIVDVDACCVWVLHKNPGYMLRNSALNAL